MIVRFLPNSCAADNVQLKIWNDPNVDWRFFDKVVIRSTWDYHYHIQDFIHWIDRVSQQSKLINSKEVFVWNYDKKYLLDLALTGVPTIDNIVSSDLETAALTATELLEIHKKIVIKPTVSASAHLTFLISEEEKIQPSLQEIFKKSDVLIQPFCESVLTDGEVSLLFFDKKFSHGLLKKIRDRFQNPKPVRRRSF